MNKMRAKFLALCVLLMSSRVSAQVNIGDVYDDVADIVERLIKGEVGTKVAAQLRESNTFGTRYFTSTAARLESPYWGNLEIALKKDLTDLVADYAFWVTRHPECERSFFGSDKPEGCSFSIPNDNKLFLDMQCSPADIKHETAVACDVGLSLKASLSGDPERSRMYAELLLADLWITLATADPTKVDRARMLENRRRVQGWLAEPKVLRTKLKELLGNVGIESSSVAITDFNPKCDLTANAELDVSKFAVKRCLQSAFSEKCAGPNIMSLQVVQSGAPVASVDISLRDLSQFFESQEEEISSLQPADKGNALVEAFRVMAKKRLYKEVDQLAKTAAAPDKATVIELEALELRVKELSRRLAEQATVVGNQEIELVEIERLINAGEGHGEDAERLRLKEKLTGLRTGIELEKKVLEELRANLAIAQAGLRVPKDAHTLHVETHYRKKGFEYGNGLELRSGFQLQEKFLLVVTEDKAKSTELELLLLEMSSAVHAPRVRSFDEDLADLVCDGCKLSDPGRVAAAAVVLAAHLDVTELQKRELYGDLGRSAHLVFTIFSSGDASVKCEEEDCKPSSPCRMQCAKKAISHISPLLARAAKQDYREVAALILDEVFSEGNRKRAEELSDDEAYQSFFKQFASYLLDHGSGEADTGVTREAFRSAATEVLSRVGEGGIPDQGRRASYWVTASISRGFQLSSGIAGQVRNRAAIDLISSRYAIYPGSWGLGASTLDILRPAFELAYRPTDRDVNDRWKAALNIVSPRVFLWLAIPEVTSRITVDGSIGFVPAVLGNCEEVSDDCGYVVIWERATDSSDHFEFAVSATYLF